MKLYVLVVSAVLMVGGCDNSALKKNDKLDLPAICAKRSEAKLKHATKSLNPCSCLV